VGFCERRNAASLPRQPVSHSTLEAESPVLPGTDAEDHRSFGLMTPGAARRSLPLRRHAIHGRMQQTNGI
jgi:hypothetical protein